MATQPFVWGARGAVSPAQLERERKVAAALAQSAQNPQTFWEGVQNATGKIGGSLLDWRADQDESTAKAAYGDKFASTLSGEPTMQDLAMLAGDEWANPGQQSVVSALLGNEIKQQDPAYGLDVAYKQAQIDALKAKPAVNLTDDEKEYIRAQDDPAFADFLKNSKAPLVDMGGGSAFTKKAEEKAAERFDGYIAGGSQAAEFTGNLNSLKDIATRLNTGKTAEVMAALGPYAEAVGLKVDGLGEAQAYQAIVDKMAPQMRAPGSGSSSDTDVKMFLNSLPSLGKTPEGNALIAQTFEAVQQHKIEAAKIAALAFEPPESGGITWQEAEAKIRALGDPYTAFKQANGKVPKSVAPDHAQTVDLNGTSVKIWAE